MRRRPPDRYTQGVSLGFLGYGIAYLVYALSAFGALDSVEPWRQQAVSVIGYSLVVLGSYVLVRARGRHVAWVLLGMFSIVGFIFMAAVVRKVVPNNSLKVDAEAGPELNPGENSRAP